jgi:hypothetical protein
VRAVAKAGYFNSQERHSELQLRGISMQQICINTSPVSTVVERDNISGALLYTEGVSLLYTPQYTSKSYALM